MQRCALAFARLERAARAGGFLIITVSPSHKFFPISSISVMPFIVQLTPIWDSAADSQKCSAIRGATPERMRGNNLA